MELLAEPQPTMAWVCAECGHGSPEPRDQQAHLDAHRQLRQFFQEWDAAAAQRRSRRPLVIGSAALLAAILLAVVALLRLTGGGDVPPSATRPGPAPAPAPGVELPRAADPSPLAPPAGGAPVRPDPSSDGSAQGRTTPPSAATSGAGTSPADVSGIAPPPAPVSAAPPAPLPPVDTIPPPAPATQTRLAVHGCLLVVCVDLGS